MFFLFFNLHSFKHIVSAFGGLEGFCRWSLEASCDGWSAAGELAAWWPWDSPDCDKRDWCCWRSRSNPSSRFCSQSLQSTSSHWRAMALLHSFLQVSQMGMLHDRELMTTCHKPLYEPMQWYQTSIQGYWCIFASQHDIPQLYYSETHHIRTELALSHICNLFLNGWFPH